MTAQFLCDSASYFQRGDENDVYGARCCSVASHRRHRHDDTIHTIRQNGQDDCIFFPPFCIGRLRCLSGCFCYFITSVAYLKEEQTYEGAPPGTAQRK
jgi:hypothetical protein